jgi:hypothetical protein
MSKQLTAAGVSVLRHHTHVTITASDEHEAKLLEDALNDPKVMALVLVTGAIKSLPDDKSRFQAVKLVQALLAAGEEVPAS